jgi:hypothetical protein
VPDLVHSHNFESYFANGWSLVGLTILQSGQPYSVIDFSGAVGSIYYGVSNGITNPIVPLAPGCTAKSAKTGLSGAFGDEALKTSCFTLPLLAAGGLSGAVPTSDPYETTFTTGQRNIFRQAFQKRMDLSLRKTFKFSERISLLYAFNIFNLFNTASLDVPQNQTQIAQSYACSNAAANLSPSASLSGNNTCPQNSSYLQYGQIVSTNAPGDQQSALNNEFVLPVVNGTGKGITVPRTLTAGQGTCVSYEYASSAGCPNNGATFGSVTGLIGGNRAITMGMHLTF